DLVAGLSAWRAGFRDQRVSASGAQVRWTSAPIAAGGHAACATVSAGNGWTPGRALVQDSEMSSRFFHRPWGRLGAHATGLGLLGASTWWGWGAARDLATVSPIHWGLILPQLVLGGVPALLSALTAGAIIFGRPGARAFVFALSVTLLQMFAVSVLAP